MSSPKCPLSVTMSRSKIVVVMACRFMSKDSAADCITFCGFKSMKRGRSSEVIDKCGCRNIMIPRVRCLSGGQSMTLGSGKFAVCRKDRVPGRMGAMGMSGRVIDAFCSGSVVNLIFGGSDGSGRCAVRICAASNGLGFGRGFGVPCAAVGLDNKGVLVCGDSRVYMVGDEKMRGCLNDISKAVGSFFGVKVGECLLMLSDNMRVVGLD